MDETDDKHIVPGDVVRLKSGGPMMTVAGIFVVPEQASQIGLSRQAACIWFDGYIKHEGIFSDKSLGRVTRHP